MTDSLLMMCMDWSSLHCIVELHFSGLSRLRLIGCTCWGEIHVKARHMLRQGTWKTCDTWRVQKGLDSDRGWAWLAGTASCAMLVGLMSLLIFAFLREVQLRTSPGVPLGPSCWLKPSHVCYPDSTKLHCWCICEISSSGSSCCCWPVNWAADFQTPQTTRVAPKNLSKQVRFLVRILHPPPTPSGGW